MIANEKELWAPQTRSQETEGQRTAKKKKSARQELKKPCVDFVITALTAASSTAPSSDLPATSTYSNTGNTSSFWLCPNFEIGASPERIRASARTCCVIGIGTVGSDPMSATKLESSTVFWACQNFGHQIAPARISGITE